MTAKAVVGFAGLAGEAHCLDNMNVVCMLHISMFLSTNGLYESQGEPVIVNIADSRAKKQIKTN